MDVVMPVLEFFQSILTQPAWIMGLFSLVGLVALRRPAHKVLTGTLKPILGYLMLSAGANVISGNLAPLGTFIETGFHITGVVPNNEVVVSMAQNILGVQTMVILILGYAVNIIVARFTKYKYIFLTGHHSMFMACLFSAVLQASGFEGVQLCVLGGMFLGLISAILPAIGQRYTDQLTDNDGIAMGHFGSLAYYISAAVGSLFKKEAETNNTEKIEMPEQLSFLRDTTISTALTMAFFYVLTVIAAYIADPQVVQGLAGESNVIVYALTCAFSFAVGVTVVYNGVRMILGDLVPAFQGISNKLIPGAIPAVDCAVFFPYAPTAVIIGFVASFIGGVVGMFIVGATMGIFIIPGMVPHFFCGATAGLYGNATGGRKGAMLGAFVNGLLITFAPALLLPVLDVFGFRNTTFGDFDFGVVGIVLGRVSEFLGHGGVYGLLALLVLVVLVPNFVQTKGSVINHIDEE
ncbi:PTS ascorbate transporter subunit IIC [Collinsella sp. zg1085]|uniref:PTS ascorbate transporter subunit IIC n=1 Tax=Collinsella sp. zg1085 TaxID=2844380 RepID=UPI001C0E5A99|nr:PTS ascorbate transporter subunit IIC [Collinsella sp. zg1085]QWT17993.1 PTS ascorbate transporter subunit IIC [Collinsella sp. zg1085]